MSAYVVEPRTICGLLALAAPERGGAFVWTGPAGEPYCVGDSASAADTLLARHFTRDELGAELLRVCRASVAARYATEDPDDPGLPGSRVTPDAFRFTPVLLAPIEGLRLAEEYEAQAACASSYHASIACTFVGALRRVLVRRIPNFELLDPPHLPIVRQMFRAAAGRRLYDALAPLFMDPDEPVNGGDVVELVGWVLETERARLASQLGTEPTALPV